MWMARIAGTPYLNFLCSVLWCQTLIPNQAPTLPPKAENISSLASDIRHLECWAFHLSMPYKKNVTTLMETR